MVPSDCSIIPNAASAADHNKATSVDDIHELADKLMLTVFEAMRGTNESCDTSEIADKIMNIYSTTTTSIDTLIGISRSQIEQESELLDLSNRLNEAKNNVKKCKSQLSEQLEKVDHGLIEVIQRISCFNKEICTLHVHIWASFVGYDHKTQHNTLCFTPCLVPK